jgi:hypothetical protein
LWTVCCGEFVVENFMICTPRHVLFR